MSLRCHAGVIFFFSLSNQVYTTKLVFLSRQKHTHGSMAQSTNDDESCLTALLRHEEKERASRGGPCRGAPPC